MSTNPSFGTEGTYSPDNLIAGDAPLRAEDVTIENGQNLTRGAVLGKVTGSGEYKLSATAAGDGSETPVAILAKDTDASGGAVEAPVYIAGDFNERSLTLGTGHTLASVKAAFLGTPIFIQPSVAA